MNMQKRRVRRDRANRLIGARTDQSGRPNRAVVVVTTVGRVALGRVAPRRYRFAIDLLLGQASEHELLRQIENALDVTYLSDLHCAQRARQIRGMQAKTALAVASERGRRSA